MHGDGARLQECRLLACQAVWNQEELALMHNHLVAPPPSDRSWAGHIPILTQRVIAGHTVTAGRLYIPGSAAVVKLVGYSITNAQEFGIRSYFADLAHNLVTQIQSWTHR